MGHYCQHSNKKVSGVSGKQGFGCFNLVFFFPVKYLAKFGTAMTQRSEVVLGALLCLKDERQIGQKLF